MIKVWKIVGNKIHLINKQSIDYEIKYIEWIDNGSKIMLWWTIYEYDINDNPRDRNNWRNECQIQVSIDYRSP